MSKIRAVVVPPLGGAYSTFIPAGLSSMQAAVGGNIEHIVPLDGRGSELGRPDNVTRALDFWCNEEFLYTPGLAFCRAVSLDGITLTPVYGALLVTASDRWGRTVSMSREEALSVLEVTEIRCPQFIHPASDNEVCAAIVETVVDAEPEWLWGVVRRDELSIAYNRIDEIEGLPLPPVGEPELTMAGNLVIRFTDNPKRSLVETRDGAALGELPPDGRGGGAALAAAGLALGEALARVAEHASAAEARENANKGLDEQGRVARPDPGEHRGPDRGRDPSRQPDGR